MPFFDGVDAKVYYRHWAAAAPRVRVLLLHGFGEHSGHYHRLAGQLNAVGIDVWGPDHVGHGHTGGPAGMFSSVDELACNANTLMDVMSLQRPTLPIVVVGHSLGALTGAMLVIRHPEVPRGLVMTGAPLWGLPAEAAGRSDLIMAMDEEYLDALADDPLGFDTAAAEPNLWRALTEAGPTVRGDLPRLTMPVLLINGEHDVFASPRKAAQFTDTLWEARAVVIRGGYHDIPNDVAHRRVAALIVEAIMEWCL